MAMQYIVEEVSSQQQPAPMDPLLQQVRLRGLSALAADGDAEAGLAVDIVARIDPAELPGSPAVESLQPGDELAAEGDWRVTLRSKIGRCGAPQPGFIVTAQLWVQSEQAIDHVRRAGREQGWLLSLKVAPRARPQLHETVPLVLGDLLDQEAEGTPVTNRALTGRGVVVGVVDYGCDFASPAFRVPGTGETRLRFLWDQNAPADPTNKSPARFGYGTEYRREEIDRVLSQTGYGWQQAVSDYNSAAARIAPSETLRSLYQELGYDPGDHPFSASYAPPPQFFSANTDISQAARDGAAGERGDDSFDAVALHGSHVLDIAAGTRFARSFRLYSTLNPSSQVSGGVAPEADLIFVQIRRTRWKGVGDFTASSHILDAVKYILERADALSEAEARSGESASPRPVVVNLSLNAYAGPHDGQTLLEMGLDAMVRERRNTAIVISAANNQRSIREHRALPVKAAAADGDVASTARLDWRLRQRIGAADSLHEVEIWYPEEPPQPGSSPLASFTLGVRSADGLDDPVLSEGGAGALQIGKAYAVWQVDDSGRREQIGEIISREEDPNNHKGTINIILREAVEARDWFMTFGPAERDCTLHAWIEYNQENQSSFAGGGESDDNSTLGSICGTRHCVVVGSSACVAPDWWGNLSPSEFTSRGPVLPTKGPDGAALQLKKPDLLGPGEGAFRRTIAGQKVNLVAAAGRYGGGPVLMRGTSQAAPHVAGAIALLLQRATAAGAALSSDEILELLHDSCRRSGDGWNPREGYGLLSVDRLIALAEQRHNWH